MENIKTEMDEKQLSRIHINNLVHLAKIDHHFDESEEELIYRIGKKAGFEENEIKDMIENPITTDISNPQSQEEQFEYLFNVVNMMMIDGRLFQKELDYCTDVAVKLGFKKIIVTVLIRAIEDGLKLEMDENEIRKEAFELISE